MKLAEHVHQTPDALPLRQHHSAHNTFRNFFENQFSLGGELGFENSMWALASPRPDIERCFDAPRVEALQLTLQGYGSGRLTVHGL